MLCAGVFSSAAGKAIQSWKPLTCVSPTGVPECHTPFPALIHSTPPAAKNALLTGRVHIAKVKVTLSHERQRRDAGVRVHGEPLVPHSGIKTG